MILPQLLTLCSSLSLTACVYLCVYSQFMGEVRDCESYLRQLQDTIKRQYTCDRNSRLGKLEDLLQDSMVRPAVLSCSRVQGLFFFRGSTQNFWGKLFSCCARLVLPAAFRSVVPTAVQIQPLEFPLNFLWIHKNTAAESSDVSRATLKERRLKVSVEVNLK